MLSKRDNLLIRPWQQRRFENHRRKVQSALPAIDSNPPAFRGHVCCKLKRKQNEKERCVQIEEDNLRLLQKMESIMKKNRLDNHWQKPQPTFLNRVKMYNNNNKDESSSNKLLKYYNMSLEELSITSDNDDDDNNNNNKRSQSCGKLKKVKCTACNPSNSASSSYTIFDERLLPWEEEYKSKLKCTTHDKIKSSRVVTSSGVQGNHTNIDGHDVVDDTTTSNKYSKSKSNNARSKQTFETASSTTPSLILTRGNLHLSINFPSDTNVILKKDGLVEKVILKDLCECKSIRK